MTRRDWAHTAVLLAVLVVTLPPLARLAKGRTPSLLASANTPFWERHPPRPLPLRGVRRIAPIPPGSVVFLDSNIHAQFWNADEDVLLRPLEHPDIDPHDDMARTGRWLEAACCLGRNDPTLRGRQDRVASRLIGTQLSDGWFGKDPGSKKRTPTDWDAQASSLRGLLAFYSVTHNPAAIYAAEESGDGIVRMPPSRICSPSLLLPLALLYRQTGDAALLTWCRQAIRAGYGDAAGECALYEVTGQRAWLSLAAHAWSAAYPTPHSGGRVQRDVAGAAALWVDTGDPRYLSALHVGRGLATCPLTPGSLTYGRIPRGLRAVVWTASRVTFGQVRLSQALTHMANGVRRATFTVSLPKPTAFLLNLPPCTSSALLNGKHIAFTGTLLRRWRNGDVLIVQAK